MVQVYRNFPKYYAQSCCHQGDLQNVRAATSLYPQCCFQPSFEFLSHFHPFQDLDRARQHKRNDLWAIRIQPPLLLASSSPLLNEGFRLTKSSLRPHSRSPSPIRIPLSLAIDAFLNWLTDITNDKPTLCGCNAVWDLVDLDGIPLGPDLINKIPAVLIGKFFTCYLTA